MCSVIAFTMLLMSAAAAGHNRDRHVYLVVLRCTGPAAHASTPVRIILVAVLHMVLDHM